RIRYAQDNDLGFADAGVHQRIDVADVAIDHVNAARRERAEDVRIEINDADLIEQGFILPLYFTDQGARRAEEAENDDTPCLTVPCFGIGAADKSSIIEIADAQPL